MSGSVENCPCRDCRLLEAAYAERLLQETLPPLPDWPAQVNLPKPPERPELPLPSRVSPPVERTVAATQSQFEKAFHGPRHTT